MFRQQMTERRHLLLGAHERRDKEISQISGREGFRVSEGRGGGGSLFSPAFFSPSAGLRTLAPRAVGPNSVGFSRPFLIYNYLKIYYPLFTGSSIFDL